MTRGKGELVLYATEDGSFKIFLHAEDGTVWLTQAEIAALFQTSPQKMTQHARAIYSVGDLTEVATCKSYLQVQNEGPRKVSRRVKAYNLDFILAVGYRVRSPRGAQFRQWATAQLKEYLIKGFVLDDARLKDPASSDFFEELLQRIHEIRASEKRFYQKVEQKRIVLLLNSARRELSCLSRQVELLKDEKNALAAHIFTRKRHVGDFGAMESFGLEPAAVA